jgi:hypothetical protein
VNGDLVRVFDIGRGKQAAGVSRPHGVLGGVRTETIGRDLYVLPDEVMPYLAASVLDRRLFALSSLIRQRYDDEHSYGIPPILEYSKAPAAVTAAPGAGRYHAGAGVAEHPGYRSESGHEACPGNLNVDRCAADSGNPGGGRHPGGTGPAGGRAARARCRVVESLVGRRSGRPLQRHDGLRRARR